MLSPLNGQPHLHDVCSCANMSGRLVIVHFESGHQACILRRHACRQTVQARDDLLPTRGKMCIDLQAAGSTHARSVLHGVESTVRVSAHNIVKPMC